MLRAISRLGEAVDSQAEALQGLQRSIGEIFEAAEQGDPEAQYDLGEAYHEGNDIPQNQLLAVKWWLKSADQRCAAAMYMLGQAYSNADGVPRDYVQAYMWFALQWNEPSGVGPRMFFSPAADEILEDLKAKMTPAQLQRLNS